MLYGQKTTYPGDLVVPGHSAQELKLGSKTLHRPAVVQKSEDSHACERLIAIRTSHSVSVALLVCALPGNGRP